MRTVLMTLALGLAMSMALACGGGNDDSDDADAGASAGGATSGGTTSGGTTSGGTTSGGATSGGSSAAGAAGSPGAGGGTGGEAGGPAIDCSGADAPELGTPCTSDSQCGCNGADYCVIKPPATEGYCTYTGCVEGEDDTVCPTGYICKDLSKIYAPLPAACVTAS